ncbi:MAG: universal stress protein [Candidatus Eisenbacteria bacterium]
MFERILVAVDGSLDADAAVRAATAMAAAGGASGGSSVDICHVFQIPEQYRADLDDAAEDALRKDGEDALAHAVRVAAEAGVKARPHLLDEADPAEAVLELASSLDASLIVLGVRGKSADMVRPLGSVSTAVSQRAGCSVLLVRRRPGR